MISADETDFVLSGPHLVLSSSRLYDARVACGLAVPEGPSTFGASKLAADPARKSKYPDSLTYFYTTVKCTECLRIYFSNPHYVRNPYHDHDPGLASLDVIEFVLSGPHRVIQSLIAQPVRTVACGLVIPVCRSQKA